MNSKRKSTAQKIKPDMKWLNRISRFMDSQFTLPGTHFRFGLDPILGFLPVIGDLFSYGISGYMIYHARKYGASGKVQTKMSINILLDAAVGSIPVLGNIFDFVYKANERNMKLLREHYEQGKHQGSGKGILIGILALIILLFAGVIYLIVAFFQWLL